MKERTHFLFGLSVGLLVLVAVIEAVRNSFDRSAYENFDIFISGLGGLRWIYDYQTLIAGIAAVWAARWSVNAIRRQIAQVDRIESDRNDAKRSAARAVLPLSLSFLSEYAEECAAKLRELLDKCENGILPKHIAIPAFPDVPVDVVSALKELIEFSPLSERVSLARLLGALQIQRSRIKGMPKRQRREEETIFGNNIKAYILDCAEIYARSASLYNFGRGVENAMPADVTRSEMLNALHNMNIFDELHEELAEQFGLRAEGVWVSRSWQA
ncbi:hypothetical protein [Ensifer adhaerens]|uniref:hypothetical protein n=1 Tax=Ensifer adhaerens TaxID=106592 RepID=UPI000CF0DD2C|nr:hypothetical protein [Ensifer adhaerens]